MDVSDILASHAAKQQATIVEKDIPLEVDPGLLMVTDLNPIDQELYEEDLEVYLQSTARDGVQVLLSTLFNLPTTPSSDGPLAQLPPPTTELPRSKPLPKPKPPTKWELFARAKGIQKKKKDRKIWDEKKQDWVNRWGRDAKNKEKEVQWATEVPANADVDYDPAKAARDARKARVAKNERQRLQNVARSEGATASRNERKSEIDRTLASTRISTASMGRFDKKLEGEKKMKGVKRKFDPTEASVESEKNASLALISKMDSDATKMKRPKTDESRTDDTVNVRKAVRFASKGRGGVALAKANSSSKAKRKVAR